MPTLKAVIDRAEDIPEAAREFYKEEDGVFLLDIEGVDKHPSTKALRGALDGQKQARKKAADEIAALKAKLAAIPDDFNPEEYASIKAKLEAYEADPDKNKGGDAAKQMQELTASRKLLEQRISTMEKASKEEIAKKDETIKKKDAFINRLLVDEGLTKALMNAGVSKEFLPAAKALHKEVVKVVEEDGKYEAIVDTDTGPLDLDRYVSDWVASDEGKPFIPPAKGVDAGGANGQRGQRSPVPGGQPNPWDKATWNLTKQGEIMKRDRVLASKLAKAAGKELPPPL